MSVPELDCDTLARRFVDDDTLALLLVGSYARGEACRSSDIDLARHVAADVEHGAIVCSIDEAGRMVTVKTLCAARQAAALTDPGAAVWQVPTLRDAVILFDRDGTAAGLIDRARTFSWDDLSEAADRHVAAEVAAYAEEALKISGGLAAGRPGQIVYGVMGLVLGLADVMAVHRRVFVTSENRVFDIALEAMSDRPAWCDAFRRAVGYDNAGPRARGRAALTLYDETVSLVDDLFAADQRAVADIALRAATKAGR